MFRKFILVSILILPNYTWAWTTGLYLGGGLGADTANFHQKDFVQIPPNFKAINRTRLAGAGVFGTVFGGYGMGFGLLYLGVELNGNASDAKFHGSHTEKIRHAVSKTTYKVNKSWGASLLPGIIIPDYALLFGRAGYVRGSFRINTSDNSLANNNTMLTGVRYGVGVEKNLFYNFGMRFEYNHITYKQRSEVGVNTKSGATKKIFVNPRTNQYEFGIVYRFG